jgi:hypothetical protein
VRHELVIERQTRHVGAAHCERDAVGIRVWPERSRRFMKLE